MAQLNLDVIEHIIAEVCTFDSKDRQVTLRSLGLVSREFNFVSRPQLFSLVKWPHPLKHDSEVGLHFFPECLWPHFKTFILDWPDYWPDLSPPAWGTIHQVEGYLPKQLDKLEKALPLMSRLHTFQMTCPFYPPKSFMLAIVGCSTIKDLRVLDTPIKAGLSPSTLPSAFNLDRLSFVPVGETNRVGEGPFDKKYHDIVYYTRSYRKRHSTDTSNGGFFPRIMPGWALVNIFCLAKPESLKYIQISGSYCSLHDFNGTWWPNLETLVLTGPEAIPDSTNLADVVGRMPKLWDLRVLFNKALASPARNIHSNQRPCFRIVEPGRDAEYAARSVQHVSEPTVFGQIKYFAASNVCSLDSAFKYFTSLEGLALIAVINHPRVPIARGEEETRSLLADLETTGSGKRLKVLRVMVECGITPSLISKLGTVCPLLENLEVEICGYRDGPSDLYMDMTEEWANALQKYQHIEQLRVGMVFCQHDDVELDYDTEILQQREDRIECAKYLSSRAPTLRRIGFQYRMRTGSHRYEDRWLDFDIKRLSDGTIDLHEIQPSWYPFPEVWKHVPL
uniref:Uncharacterized protein n=1 Tax=Psilocybe cubensis TaxID=181762 RepID=A0A8H7XN63_PSICU